MLLFSENAKKKFLVLGLLLMLLLGVAFISGHGERRLKTFYNSIFQPELMDTSNEYYQNYNMIKAVGSGQL
jgi:predicted membrane protein